MDKDFNNPFSDKYDKPRLSGQMAVIKSLMLDGVPRTLSEIEFITGYPQASISAHLRSFRKRKYGSYRVFKKPKGNRYLGLWEYQVLEPLLNEESNGQLKFVN